MSEISKPTHFWNVAGGRRLSLASAHLVGIVNATPDSFADGGMHSTVGARIGHAMRLVEEGATVIDVGGESTRPGATRVPASEQIDRTAPVIEGLARVADVVISIDTTRAAVAEVALDAGAHVVNDVAAGLEDEAMLPLVAGRACGLILMHRRRPPDLDSYSHEYEDAPEYADVVETVRRFLIDRAGAAERAGVPRESIVIDPGLGFGKTVGQNYDLIRRTRELVATGYPVLSAASRKSFIGAETGDADPAGRVVGSTVVSVVHHQQGVRLFRVHDVAAHREALAIVGAIDRESPPRPAGEPSRPDLRPSIG